MAESFAENQERINARYNDSLVDARQNHFNAVRANIERKAEAKRLGSAPLPENLLPGVDVDMDNGNRAKEQDRKSAEGSSDEMRSKVLKDRIKNRAKALQKRKAETQNKLGVVETDFLDDILIVIKDISDLFTGGLLGILIGGIIYGIIIIRAKNKGAWDDAVFKRKVSYHLKLWLFGSIPGLNLIPEILLKKLFPLSNS